MDLVGHYVDEQAQHEREETHTNHEHEDALSGSQAVHCEPPR